jgi:hypothetical protein
VDQHMTGVDIQKRFHTVYAHCDTGTGPTARDTLQMIGRFRNVTSGRVVCCLPEKLAPIPEVTYKTECRAIRDGMDEGANKAGFRHLRLVKTRGGQRQIRPHPLHGLTAYTRVENKECFQSSFMRQIDRMGWRVRMHTPPPTMSAWEKHLAVAMRHAACPRHANTPSCVLDPVDKTHRAMV